MMKNIILFFVFSLIISPSLVFSKSISYFQGERFKAEIVYDCEEGNVSCDKLSLKSTSLRDNSSIILKGETINTNCPNICDFKGYRFSNGKYDYSFYPSLKGDDLWEYVVTYKDKVITQDFGLMK
ncbi:hypothetical protein F6Q07_02495 [Pectobacterium parmentieri]|uniref:hypothetical protein n=1 Tax=Pectobacterium parmentieri TaxID=1905730 RepID=UPI000EB588AE|nr:hypothetical protein [Pectobacterium parmentieri]AYH01652.1 hypothetical protein C5E26_12275 [Pectobacterium parmentieri]AYH27919.1 hypothetical protein C5E20_12680 [Pectobacterium parmentieri]AYH32225.1 hypothetical protein C5E19_11710 [Pectobacterium parmentieri]MBI0517009.1 hypothetical protein [Pectobacterium parmentieri]